MGVLGFGFCYYDEVHIHRDDCLATRAWLAKLLRPDTVCPAGPKKSDDVGGQNVFPGRSRIKRLDMYSSNSYLSHLIQS